MNIDNKKHSSLWDFLKVRGGRDMETMKCVLSACLCGRGRGTDSGEQLRLSSPNPGHS